MIRAVLDVNVLVGGFPARSGRLRFFIEWWRAGRFVLLTSAYILEATERAWRKPYWSLRFPETERTEALRVQKQFATVVEVVNPVVNFATHAEDDLVLSVVTNSKADILVTGDKELLELSSLGGTPIVTAREFVEVLLQRGPHSHD